MTPSKFARACHACGFAFDFPLGAQFHTCPSCHSRCQKGPERGTTTPAGPVGMMARAMAAAGAAAGAAAAPPAYPGPPPATQGQTEPPAGSQSKFARACFSCGFAFDFPLGAQFHTCPNCHSRCQKGPERGTTTPGNPSGPGAALALAAMAGGRGTGAAAVQQAAVMQQTVAAAVREGVAQAMNAQVPVAAPLGEPEMAAEVIPDAAPIAEPVALPPPPAPAAAAAPAVEELPMGVPL